MELEQLKLDRHHIEVCISNVKDGISKHSLIEVRRSIQDRIDKLENVQLKK